MPPSLSAFEESLSKSVRDVSVAMREADRVVASNAMFELLGRAANTERRKLPSDLPQEIQEELLNSFLDSEWEATGQLRWAKELAKTNRPGRVLLRRLTKFRRSFARRSTREASSTEGERAKRVFRQSIYDKLLRVLAKSTVLGRDGDGLVVLNAPDDLAIRRARLPGSPERKNDGQIIHASDAEYEEWLEYRIARHGPDELGTLADELARTFEIELQPLTARPEASPVEVIRGKRAYMLLEEILDEEDQKVVWMYAIQEMTFPEIGEELGTDAGRARTRWRKIQRQFLRHQAAEGGI